MEDAEAMPEGPDCLRMFAKVRRLSSGKGSTGKVWSGSLARIAAESKKLVAGGGML